VALMTYCDAINLSLKQEMRRDDRVFVYGIEDKMFGSLAGIQEEFGIKRCFSMPIAEESGLGIGLGAALTGLRPIHNHIRVDFLLLAMNQLANLVSSCRYGSEGAVSVPLVIRAVIGRGWGQGYQHSKSLQGMFAQIPGIKVVMPTTPNDAKGLLASAIREDNPVLILEHRWLYWQSGQVEYEPFTIEIGKSSLKRKGQDLTVVATSWMNVEAMQAAEILSERGVELEIVDAQSVNPLDDTQIIGSVNKTGNCIVADNDWLHCGFSAEISTRIYEKCWSNLRRPIIRIGFAPIPCPTARDLENLFYPNAASIVRGAEHILGLSPTDLSSEDFYSHERKFLGPF